MEVRLHDDVAAFAARAGVLLDRDPVRHTVAQSVLAGLAARGERGRAGAIRPSALFLTVQRRGAVIGALLWAAGAPAVVSALPPRYAAAADAAAAVADPGPPGATGPVAEAEAYAAAHAARTGATVRVAMRQRLHRLVSLVAPRGVSGSARVAGAADVGLLAAWRSAFVAEALGSRTPGGSEAPADPRTELLESMRHGAAHLLWEVGGHPVAYAMARPPAARTSRIGPVYTPPEHRGHGHGSAVTAAASAWARAAGACEVVLLTDLANPVSNAIYPRIGFRPVLDALEITFHR